MDNSFPRIRQEPTLGAFVPLPAALPAWGRPIRRQQGKSLCMTKGETWEPVRLGWEVAKEFYCPPLAGSTNSYVPSSAPLTHPQLPGIFQKYFISIPHSTHVFFSGLKKKSQSYQISSQQLGCNVHHLFHKCVHRGSEVIWLIISGAGIQT